MTLSALALLVAQAVVAATAPPHSGEQAQLTECLQQARTDPATAITTASLWLNEAHDAGKALPQQCLGQAYVSLLRWDAAHGAFVAARDAAQANDYAVRARLGAMAGNAALAKSDYATALADLESAVADAERAADKPLAGPIGADKARALVGLGRNDEAAATLQQARADAPQDPDVWLLSATLSRRAGDLKSAQAQIETAAGLAPTDPAIGLEAGVVAELAGNDEAARKNWNAVVALAPDGPEAKSARAYLAEIGSTAK
ncbi:MAG: tetratricopeptide repeat protein [Croceibacterium sp.]